MNYLYAIGGCARTGKTTVLKALLERLPIMPISSDILRASMRNVLFDEPYVSVEKLDFEGSVTFHRPLEKGSEHKTFKQSMDEDGMTWKAVVGAINPFDRRGMPVVIEGIAITPERLHALKLKNLTIRAAFLGFSDPSHIETMLVHAKKENDWVNKVITENDGDETSFRTWADEQIVQSKKTKELCEQFGYAYFDITEKLFDEHVNIVRNYLLSK